MGLPPGCWGIEWLLSWSRDLVNVCKSASTKSWMVWGGEERGRGQEWGAGSNSEILTAWQMAQKGVWMSG